MPLAAARAADAELCAAAIRAAERASPLPRGLLGAVSFAEAGRRDPERSRAVAWPWTVNNAGDGRYFGSKREAIAHVEALRAQGKRNIDVGCMQINLMHHPDAFASLEAAFEPTTNVAYGADFLGRLKQETGSWARAIERYHTADPARGQAYRARVFDRWQDVRMADAMGVAGANRRPPESGRSAGGITSGSELAGEPGTLPLRRQLAALNGRGPPRFAPAMVKPTVPRPLRSRGTVGYVRNDGRIAGSGLRLGPRRSAPGRVPGGKDPPADLDLRTAHRAGGSRLTAMTPPASEIIGPESITGRGRTGSGHSRRPVASPAGGA